MSRPSPPQATGEQPSVYPLVLEHISPKASIQTTIESRMTELTVLSAIQSLIADENLTIFPFHHYFSCFAGSYASLWMDEVS
jgi:hypothetical protein